MLTGNSFVTVRNTDRVNILIDADTKVGNGAFAHQFLVDSHQFGEIDVGHPICGTSAIRIMNVTATASDIQIGASNQFVGAYSDSVVDDARRVAVTMVGFPNTSTSTPPTALPNGNPTVGSGGTPWPGSYSYGHYLPPTPALSNPGTGWVLFTNSAGNLAAQYESNDPIVILYHP
ncbi:MAG: hypothetical protein ACREHF_08380 [Rhizomicrobium sp.]